MQSWSVLAFFALILVVQSRSVYKKKEDDVGELQLTLIWLGLFQSPFSSLTLFWQRCV